ncbi:MAG: hypothetical protein BWY70_00913 [Bacteroidetes bacterium ADurb.Bin408]|nr:MAG: hypothetical protein BWY70_00913 [Bacteroidetes bacterium ADurb.Bin408]
MAEENSIYSKPVYNLEERTYRFAKNVRIYIKKLPQTLANIEDAKQLIKSSGSVGANYIEANEALGKKDFAMRVKISRKEAKESAYFLKLIYETNPKEFEKEGIELYNDAVQLKKYCHQLLKSQNSNL